MMTTAKFEVDSAYDEQKQLRSANGGQTSRIHIETHLLHFMLKLGASERRNCGHQLASTSAASALLR